MSRDIHVNVFVTLKAGVLDPQGRAVENTLHRMGFDDVTSVRIGKLVEITMRAPDGDDPDADDAARQRAIAMCRELLANPVTEDFTVEIATGARDK